MFPERDTSPRRGFNRRRALGESTVSGRDLSEGPKSPGKNSNSFSAADL